MSYFQNATTFTEFLTATNTATDGWLIWAICSALAVTLYLYTVPWGKWRALTYSTFITGLVLLVFNIAGLVDYYLITVDLLLFATGFIMMIISKEG